MARSVGSWGAGAVVTQIHSLLEEFLLAIELPSYRVSFPRANHPHRRLYLRPGTTIPTSISRLTTLRDPCDQPLLCSAVMTIMTIMTIDENGNPLGWEDSGMGAQSWTVAEAKAKFSEMIKRAMSEGPQTITRKGRTAAVVVGAEEWQRKTKRVGNLAEFFAASPLRGSGLKLSRHKEWPRKINL